MSTERDELVRLMEYDFSLFEKIIFGDPSNPMHYHIRLKTPPFHKKIINELLLMETGDKFAIVAPRSHAKTTKVNLIYPLHRILYGYEYFFLMISESEDQSKLNLEALGNEIEFNPKLREYFGNRMGSTWGKEEKIIIGGINRDVQCKVKIRGTGQTIRGIKFGPYRPTLTIIDDGEGDRNSLSETQRMQFRRWLNASVIPGSDDSKLVFIGTIVDEDSYLNRIVGSKAWRNGKYIREGWKILYYQSVTQDTKPGEFIEEGKEIFGKDGIPEVLWKERKSYKWLMDEKARLKSEGDLAYYYQEYQNIPLSESQRIFKKEWIQYWEGFFIVEDGIAFIMRNDEGRREKIPVNLFMGVDPASSENIKSDFTVVMVIAVDSEYNIYILEYFNEQVDPMSGADALWELMEKHHTPSPNKQPKAIKIEKTGHEMLEPYMRRKSKESGRFYNLIPKDAIKTKYARIMEMTDYFKHKAVFLKEDHFVLESQLLNFRKTGTFKKDTLDALKWAMEDIFAPNLEKKDGEWIMPVSAVGADWETGRIIDEGEA